MSTNLSTSMGHNGSTEWSLQESQSTVLEDGSPDELDMLPLDLRVTTTKDSEERVANCQRQRSFLNAPLLKDVCMPVTEVQPFSAQCSKPEDLSNNAKPLQIAKPPSPPPPSPNSQPMEIVAADSTITESKTKVALKFCLKKCGEISLYFRSSSRKAVAPTNCRFQSLMTSLKNTMKSLAKTMPSTNVINRIHNSVIDKIKGKRLQDCVKLFSLKFIPFNKHKKIKGSEKLASQLPPSKFKGYNEKTFVNPDKKPELYCMSGFRFAKPKFYECSYCDTRFYKLPVYIKHIRRHAEIIRCDTCCKAFSSVVNKRRHQLQCHRRNLV